MRAIIIEEERFAEVADLMRHAGAKIKKRSFFIGEDAQGNAQLLPQDKFDALVDEIHRSIHFEFVRWAQSHGASCVR